MTDKENRQELALSEPRRKKRFFDSSDSLRMTGGAASRMGRQERQDRPGVHHKDTKTQRSRHSVIPRESVRQAQGRLRESRNLSGPSADYADDADCSSNTRIPESRIRSSLSPRRRGGVSSGVRGNPQNTQMTQIRSESSTFPRPSGERARVRGSLVGLL